MEIITSIPGKIMEKIVDQLFDAAGRRFGYLRKHKHIEALRNEAKKVTDRRNDLQAEIDAAERDGKTIRDEVQSWIAEVDGITKEVEKFLEDEVKANKRCLGGWCINLRSRYKISKEAEEKTLAISALIGVGGTFRKDVSRPAPPPPIISFSEGFSAFKSRESIMKQIMKAMEDENISIIGIWGMGGVGKTTLVKEIQKQAKEMKMFDEVAMAVVSQTPNITKIQNEIASWLGFKDLPNENDPTRASSLRSRIEKARRILVILDDIWGRIELSEVGIPYGKDYRGCNILLTSRSHVACNQMGAHEIFPVRILTKEESWSLFREVAGPEVDSPEINPTAREVTNQCGGLPIAILTVGRALKDADKHVWEDANEQLKKSSPTSIDGMQEHVLSRVELSYNYLKSEEAKSIFLLCSCFPEDYEIPIEVLARYGMGLMFLHNIDSMEEARGRTRSVVSTLIFSFLLTDSDEKGYVKMHDVVRYVAQQIASQNKFLIKAGVKLKDWPSRDSCKDLKGISLMCNNIDEVPDGLDMESPNLQALLLQENSVLKIPNNFFQGMKDVKVLDLSFNKLQSLPPSLSFLANLITLRIRGWRQLGGDLSVIGKLSRLEILDLSYTDVMEIPISFGQLRHLRLLDLTDCNLKIIPRGVILCLYKLEELYMPRFRNWDFEDGHLISNARFIELQALSRLTSLHIFIPRGIFLPPNMSFGNLKSFSISICETYDWWGSFFIGEDESYKRFSRVLNLSLDTRNSELRECIKNLIFRAELLHIGKINRFENILRDLDNEGFNELVGLSIKSCKEMKYLLNTHTLETTPCVAFNKLEYLAIEGNPSFLEICNGQLPPGYFNNVKSLLVQGCDNMLKILPSHLLQRVQNLECLSVGECEALAYVFEFEGFQITEGEIELCSSLKELWLWELFGMTHIWKGDVQFVSLHNLEVVSLDECSELREVFPPNLVQSLVHLKEISISACRNLEEIFGKKAAEEIVPIPWKRRDPSLALGNLVFISIESCRKLRSLFTTSMVKSLVRLQSLYVSSCPRLKEIITATDDEGEEGASTAKITITFPSLFSLDLTNLYGLSCFCSGLYTIEFQALKSLTIIKCPSMKTFGYGEVQVTPKLTHPRFDDKEYCWKGNLNEAIQHMFNNKEVVNLAIDP